MVLRKVINHAHGNASVRTALYNWLCKNRTKEDLEELALDVGVFPRDLLAWANSQDHIYTVGNLDHMWQQEAAEKRRQKKLAAARQVRLDRIIEEGVHAYANRLYRAACEDSEFDSRVFM